MTSNQSASSGGRSFYLLMICLVASLGGLLFGFDTAVISGAEPLFTKEFKLDDKMEGFVASAAIIGCLFGALGAGMLTDRFGRKKVLLLSALLFFISAVWCWFCQTAWQLVWARLVGGLGIGIASLTSPLYIAEISPPKSRGRLVALQQLAIVLGILGAFFSNSLVNGMDLSSAAKWRWMFLVAVVPSALFAALILPVPESPRWLTKQGFKDKARAILARVLGEREADVEMAQITDALAHEGGTLAELFKPGVRRALFVGVTLAVFTQVTGINAIMYYAPKVFQEAGFGEAAAYWCSVWVGVTNLGFTLLSMVVVDRLGRKPLLLIGATCMGLALGAVGYSFSTSSLFKESDVRDFPALVKKLRAKADPVSKFLVESFSPPTVAMLVAWGTPGAETSKLPSALIGELNRVLRTNTLYEPKRFDRVSLVSDTGSLLAQKPTGEDLVRLNRMLLEDAYADELIDKGHHRGVNGLEMLLGVLAYVASFAFSMGVVGWVVISEIYPTRTRGRAMSVATAGVWGACYLVSVTFPFLLTNIGSAMTFWTYAFMCALAIAFVWRFVPETKGRTLEEIEKSW
ncbi:MAG: sugar porter family MFS transporter [Verrucomicrobia bacterium]|nr:sugar porter family MFS transporter [Verrucomicrobiota bacterium]